MDALPSSPQFGSNPGDWRKTGLALVSPWCKPRWSGRDVERGQPYENNHLREPPGCSKRRCRRFCGCEILTNPPGSTSRGCNLLILWRKFWVENLVPNQIQPFSLSLLDSIASILLTRDELRRIALILVEACCSRVLSPPQFRLQRRKASPRAQSRLFSSCLVGEKLQALEIL